MGFVGHQFLNPLYSGIQCLMLTATTAAPGATVTLHRMTPAAGRTLLVQWGDGATTTIAAGDIVAQTHIYAAAGTYYIRVTRARDIVQIDLHDAQLSGFRSAQLSQSAITYFVCYSLGAATASVINSANMVAWTPTYWRLSLIPAGTYTINSADMVAWTPTYWWLYSMSAGTYTINSANMVAWTPTTWYLYSMPAGTYTINSADMVAWTPTYWYLHSNVGSVVTVAAANFVGWTRATYIELQNNGLLQAQVNAVLWGIYQATLARTVNGGTLNVGGTNAAPSGIYQAAATCPVDVATPGKEVCHELVNDGCDAIAAGETWTTVTFTA